MAEIVLFHHVGGLNDKAVLYEKQVAPFVENGALVSFLTVAMVFRHRMLPCRRRGLPLVVVCMSELAAW